MDSIMYSGKLDQMLSGKQISKNIAIITYSFYEIDYRVRRYAEILANNEYSVDVFALRGETQEIQTVLNGVHIHHIQKRKYNEKGFKSYLFRMLMFFIRVSVIITRKHLRFPYSVAHINNPPDILIFSAVVPKLMGCKLIFDMHENLPELYSAKFNESQDSYLVKALLLCERIATRFSDFTIVAHDLLRDRVIRRDHIPEKKCMALLNYPSRKIFTPSKSKPNDCFRIIYPGTISYQHGIDIAIKAMTAVKKQSNFVRLELYGKLNDSAYYLELKALIDKLNLQDCVTFHQVVPLDELRIIFQNAHAGVVPKRGGIFGSEAFSTKILEFMAAGLPVIVSRTKIDEYYYDSSAVMFFEPENSEELAQCILKISQDTEMREFMVKTGLEYVAENNWEIKGWIYLDIIRKLQQ